MIAAVSVEKPARPQTLREAGSFLESIGYSTRWLTAPHASLVVARLESNLLCGIGVATLEGVSAVLMSFAVHPDSRRLGIGRRMAEIQLAHLRSCGAETAYLFSTVAGGFWEKIGFSRTPVEEVAAKAPDHFQVRQFIADDSIWSDTAFRRDLSER
jgi:N-acetylglutamate synthase-like GNAT family acetyltransferase